MPDSRSTAASEVSTDGVTVARRYTEPGIHPFDAVEWEIRDAVIGNPEKPVFEQRGLEFPLTWSQNSTNIVAQKYFRGRLGSDERESSVKQMIGRVAGTIAGWGRAADYFASPEDADTFEAELTHILLHQMKSRMSGWSTSSTTILAARRVPPPDLMLPAQASAPRMNDTGPEAVPPLERGSIEPRILERLTPDPEPPRKIMPSLVFQSRIERMSSSTLKMKQADA